MRRTKKCGLVLWLLLGGLSVQAQLNRVPAADINFEESVTAWWLRHPLNPEGPNFSPVILSPSFVMDVEAGADLGSVIAALPESGGTIRLAPGTYNGDFKIVGRSDIHLIAPQGAVFMVRRGLIIAGSEESIDYDDFNQGFKQRIPEYINGWFNPIENVYLKNITFDGAGEALGAIHIKTSNGVMIDSCVFKGMSDPLTGHGALVNAHAGADSVWIRNSHFIGSQRWAVYFDGGYGSGIIDSVIRSNFYGGILWLCNEDFSMDFDDKGYFTKEERRNMQYAVVYGSRFEGGLHTGISATGNDLLVRKNEAEGFIRFFTFFNPKTSLINPHLVHHCYNLYVEANTVHDVEVLAYFNHELDEVYPGWDNKSRIGRYTVRGNRIRGRFREPIRHTGQIDGPNIVCGNCWADPACVTDDTCTE